MQMKTAKLSFASLWKKPKEMGHQLWRGICLYFNFHQKWSKLRTNIRLGIKCSPIENNL
jgi:hypothetical protein